MTATNGNYKSCGNESCDCMQGTYPCVYMNPGSPCNDEFWDGTDGACPAWWRGADDGVVVVVRGIHKTLDALQRGEEPPRNFGSSEINDLVERIETLYKSMKALG